MTRPLRPSQRRPSSERPAPSPARVPNAPRPLEPGFLEWISRRNAPPLRQLELPIPPEIQIEDEPDTRPPRDRRR